MAKPDIRALQSINPDAIFTTIEASKLLGVTRQGVLQMFKRGRIKGVKIAGTWYIKGIELLNLIIE